MALVAKELSKRYGDLVALKNVSFDVKDGEFVCIIGPSGCGKTTLLRIVAGLTPPTSGCVIVDGEEIRGPSQDRGFVFQEYTLLPWRTARENIELGLELQGMAKEERFKLAQKYIDLVRLRGFEDAHPKELSGGMQQRVAIARALITDPEMILMDEPFGALDAQTRNLMQEELLRIRRASNKTILFVTHNVDEAVFLADRIIVMSTRPGEVKKVITVNISHPRNRTGTKTNKIRRDILRILEAEIGRSSETPF